MLPTVSHKQHIYDSTTSEDSSGFFLYPVVDGRLIGETR
jgi:hypothetical protein